MESLARSSQSLISTQWKTGTPPIKLLHCLLLKKFGCWRLIPTMRCLGVGVLRLFMRPKGYKFKSALCLLALAMLWVPKLSKFRAPEKTKPTRHFKAWALRPPVFGACPTGAWVSVQIWRSACLSRFNRRPIKWSLHPH